MYWRAWNGNTTDSQTHRGPRGTCYFKRLSPELRNEIYEIVLQVWLPVSMKTCCDLASTSEASKRYDRRVSKYQMPSSPDRFNILFVDKQFNNEASWILFTKACLVLRIDGGLIAKLSIRDEIWKPTFPSTPTHREKEIFWKMAANFRNLAVQYPRSHKTKMSLSRLIGQLRQLIDLLSISWKRYTPHLMDERKTNVVIDLSNIFMAYSPFNSNIIFDDSAQPSEDAIAKLTPEATNTWNELVKTVNSLQDRNRKPVQWQFACRGLLEEKSRRVGRQCLINFVQLCKAVDIECTVLWGMEYEGEHGWETVFETLCLPKHVRYV